MIWFKHVHDQELVDRFTMLRSNEPISLDADGVVGLWRRMRTGKDGRPVPGLRPEGRMKDVWNEWFKSRKGLAITVREVTLADDYLKAGSEQFSEWNSPEDEAAFRDL
ncbi:MAG: hypothetical protein ACXIVF_01030 [Rhizobiaceae bacterium]